MNSKYQQLMDDFKQASSERDSMRKAEANSQATANLSKAYNDAINSARVGNIGELVDLYNTYLGRLIFAFRKNERNKERYFLDIPQDIANKAVVKFLSSPYRNPERALIVLGCSERKFIYATHETIERFVFVYQKEGLGEKEGLLRKIFAESKAF